MKKREIKRNDEKKLAHSSAATPDFVPLSDSLLGCVTGGLDHLSLLGLSSAYDSASDDQKAEWSARFDACPTKCVYGDFGLCIKGAPCPLGL